MTELPERHSTSDSPSPAPGIDSSYQDFDYDFVDESIRPTYMLYVKQRMESKVSYH